ncbi:cell division topological specificity factor homolog, chloroplastic [Beta vulgaris subsp. vulgaris]|uniref:cell division topological specificity factor homolog, chloroplastic n=1 Tax=Beta vulgaris subsp. vulgaris TaxID=3555 RepID=UPI00203703DD|nr:cell division topological specificity factor homolog, chloroplastic [Beta vulgaris subsp. vulgaris]
MAISGDLRVFATLAPHRTHQLPLRTSSHSSSKVDVSSFPSGGLSISEISPRKLTSVSNGSSFRCQSNLSFGVTGDDKTAVKSFNQDAETFLLHAINLNFFERLNLAWKIVFPPPKTRRSSNAMIAKQRLKMILFADRCAVSDEAKQKIVKSIVSALSDFVEIESQEKVQLNVATDIDLGTVCSVTVPVRRVKPEYQEDDETGSIMSIDYKDNGETSGAVDVRFDFYMPNENSLT